MKRKLISLIAAASMLISAFPMRSYAAIQYVNDTPKGWAQEWVNLGFDDGFTIGLDNTESYEGNMSMKLESKGQIKANHYFKITHTIPIEPGKEYIFGCHVKAENNPNCRFNIEWQYDYKFIKYESSFDWRCFEANYINNSDTKTSVKLSIINENNGGTVWFDSFYWYEVDEDGNKVGANLFTNGNFDTGEKKIKNNSGSSSSNQTVSGFDKSLEETFNNIMKKESFSADEVMAVQGAMPVLNIPEKTGDITIDGSSEDWKSYSSMQLPTTSEQYQIYNSDAEREVTAKYAYTYDDKYLYFYADVEDPVHTHSTTDSYWMYDSIQMGISDKNETYGLEIGLAYDTDNDISYLNCSSLTDEQLKSIDFKAQRNGIVTTYEMAFPWSIRYPEGKPESFLCAFLVNNNDGVGREYCVQTAPGISEGKTNKEFPELYMKTVDWYTWGKASGTTVDVGGKIDYRFSIINNGEKKDFQVKIGNKEEKITLDRGQGRNIFYTHNVGEKYGDYTLNATISYGDITDDHSFEYTVTPNKEYFNNTFEEYDIWLDDLGSLIQKCNDHGITTDYETSAYEILKEFYDYTKEDIGKGKYNLAAFNVDEMRKIYQKTKADLESYLAGEKQSRTVPRYVTSKVDIEGKNFYADVEENGVIERRPVYLYGFGHWITPEQMEIFNKNYGSNATQIVIAPSKVLMESKEGYGFEVSPDGMSALKKQLDSAEKNNVSVAINLEIHTFPDYLIKKYPEMAVTEAGGGYFMRFNISHPAALAAIDAYAKAVAELCSQYKCVNSFIVGNEMMYRTTNIPNWYEGYYAQYLTQLYMGDISKLNENYGTAYNSFLEVDMPKRVENTAHFYDYRNFNTSVFNAFFKRVAERIEEVIPDAKFHTKWVSDIRFTDYGQNRSHFMMNGMDPEAFNEWCDINGNDSIYFFDYLVGQNHPLDILMGCDIQVGTNGAPVYNSEAHLIADKNKKIGDKYAKLVGAHVWQQAIHSTASLVSWMIGYRNWEYSDYSERPDCLYVHAQTNMDIQRNSDEIAAFNNKQGEICMFYSQTSRVYDSAYLNILSNIYANAVYTGRKVDFVTETTIKNLQNYKVLILAANHNLSAKALNEIKVFSDNGGKIIMFGEDCLKYDEYNKPHNADIVQNVIKQSTIVPITTLSISYMAPNGREVQRIIDDTFADLGFNTVELIDVKTGEKVDRVEYMHTEYDGNLLINMANWDLDDAGDKPDEYVPTLKIRVNGEDYNGSIIELRSGEAYPAQFELKPFTAIMLKLDV